MTGSAWLRAFTIVLVCYGLAARGDVPAPDQGGADEAGAAQDVLSPEQREQIEQLEAIGYLAGSRQAPVRENVVAYKRELAYPGINLFTSGHAPEAVLMDMDGRVLHTWRRSFHDVWPDQPEPESGRGERWRRAYLYENGDVLAVFEGAGLIKVDKDSNLLWAYSGHAHHDLEVLPSGTIYVLTRKAHMIPHIHFTKPVLEDFITVLSPDGEELRSVSILEAFERAGLGLELADRIRDAGDIFHTNTLEWFDGSRANHSPLYRRGNVLISLKVPNMVAIVDMDAERVVWYTTGPWVRQHQPVLLDNGNMLLFDNNSFQDYSKVIEFEPLTGQVVWTYVGSPPSSFYTEMCGSNQLLPNGNVLITETEGGRAFEVTREGEIVWEYVNPYRTGENDEQIAYIFEMIRLRLDFPVSWAAPPSP